VVAEEDAPEAIAFVLKRDSPEEWYSGPTGDYWIAFKPADPNAIGGIIIERYMFVHIMYVCYVCVSAICTMMPHQWHGIIMDRYMWYPCLFLCLFLSLSLFMCFYVYIHLYFG
jgi:hypothetical protein